MTNIVSKLVRRHTGDWNHHQWNAVRPCKELGKTRSPDARPAHATLTGAEDVGARVCAFAFHPEVPTPPL